MNRLISRCSVTIIVILEIISVCWLNRMCIANIIIRIISINVSTCKFLQIFNDKICSENKMQHMEKKCESIFSINLNTNSNQYFATFNCRKRNILRSLIKRYKTSIAIESISIYIVSFSLMRVCVCVHKTLIWLVFVHFS